MAQDNAIHILNTNGTPIMYDIHGNSLGAISSGITSPLSIPDCRMWLDASQLEGLEDDDPVELWPDLTGNGYDATVPDDIPEIPEVPGVAEIDRVTVIASSGAFTLANEGNPLDPINFNATPSEVQDTIDAYTGPGATVVSGSSLAAGLTITFQPGAEGPFEFTVDDNSTNGTVVVERLQEGASPSPAVPAVLDTPPVYKAASLNGMGTVEIGFIDDGGLYHLLIEKLDLLRAIPGCSVFAVMRHANGGYAYPLRVHGALGTDVDRFTWNGIGLLARPTDGAGNGNLIDIDDGGNQCQAWAAQGATIDAVHGGGCIGPLGVFGSNEQNGAVPGSFADTDSEFITIGLYDGIGGTTSPEQGFAELIVYGRALSARERRLVQEYLSDKWGCI